MDTVVSLVVMNYIATISNLDNLFLFPPLALEEFLNVHDENAIKRNRVRWTRLKYNYNKLKEFKILNKVFDFIRHFLNYEL